MKPKIVDVKKITRNIIFKFRTAIKINSFQRQSINALSQDLIEGQKCLSNIGNQLDIDMTIGILTMKTTTNRQKPKIQ